MIKHHPALLDCLIVGAGAAGLAAGQAVQKARRSFAILDAGRQPGGSWSGYYDSLELFSPRELSSLPGLKMPGAARGYPSRDEIVVYLRRYADAHSLPVINGVHVTGVDRIPAGFVVRSSKGSTWTARNVIVATGGFGTPNWPDIPGVGTFNGEVLHSASYRNPKAFIGREIVVVGAGNTAVQIAVELADVATVSLATRRQIRYLPQRPLGVDIHHWLRLSGLDRTRLVSDQGTPVMDDGRLRRAIANRHPRQAPMFDAYDQTGVVWSSGERQDVDVVLFATGYQPSVSFVKGLDGALDRHARPDHRNGVARKVPGLFFVGIPLQRNFASATLRGFGPDAAYVVNRMFAATR